MENKSQELLENEEFEIYFTTAMSMSISPNLQKLLFL